METATAEPIKQQMPAQGNVKAITLSAVIIRADGRREERGVIAHYRAPWWKRALWGLIRFLKNPFRKEGINS